MKQIYIAITLVLLSACSLNNEVATIKSLAKQPQLAVVQPSGFDWVTADEGLAVLGNRHLFEKVVSSFLSDAGDASTGPTIYDSWIGMGFTWLLPNDVPNSPLGDMFTHSGEVPDWSKAMLVKMTVGRGISADANALTIERPWRVKVRGSTKWVDTVVFESVGDCYRAAGTRCENPIGESYQYIEVLKLSGALVESVDCSIDFLSAQEHLDIYTLAMPGKKPQPVWVYSTWGSSGVVYSEFGISFHSSSTSNKLCESIAKKYK